MRARIPVMTSLFGAALLCVAIVRALPWTIESNPLTSNTSTGHSEADVAGTTPVARNDESAAPAASTAHATPREKLKQRLKKPAEELRHMLKGS